MVYHGVRAFEDVLELGEGAAGDMHHPVDGAPLAERENLLEIDPRRHRELRTHFSAKDLANRAEAVGVESRARETDEHVADLVGVRGRFLHEAGDRHAYIQALARVVEGGLPSHHGDAALFALPD